MPEIAHSATRLDRFKLYYEKNERWVDIAFFAGGFVFDVATLGRVDAWVNIAQQVLYLAMAGAILLQMFFDEGKPLRDLDAMPAIKRWYFQYRTVAVHFLLGSLLSLYTLFFFKSSSLLVSFAFLLFLVAVLVLTSRSNSSSWGCGSSSLC